MTTFANQTNTTDLNITDGKKNVSLGERMKSYESENFLLPYQPYLVRLDGKNFSTFTNGFKSPFDKNFTNSMVVTMNDLVKFTNASTGFCCSDEITLIFPPVCTKEEYDLKENKTCHLYNGRIIKLNTILASRCTGCL